MKGQKLKFMPTEPRIAPENARMRNTEKSNIGWARLRSIATKAAKLAADAPSRARPAALAKPSPGPCVM